MLDNISDCMKILLLQFTDQVAKSRAIRRNWFVYVINRGKISKRKTFEWNTIKQRKKEKFCEVFLLNLWIFKEYSARNCIQSNYIWTDKMNLSNDRSKNSFVSLQFCVVFFIVLLTLIPIALIALEAVIERRRIL